MRTRKIKFFAFAGMLAVAVVLSGCSQGVPSSKQNNLDTTKADNDTKKLKPEDASIAKQRIDCLKGIVATYKDKLNEECRKLAKEDGCKLPASNNLSVQNAILGSQDECYKKYPGQEKLEGEEQIQRTMERFKCLNKADQTYVDSWDSQCSQFGKAKQCALLSAVASNLDNRRSSARNECYNKYPEK